MTNKYKLYLYLIYNKPVKIYYKIMYYYVESRAGSIFEPVLLKNQFSQKYFKFNLNFENGTGSINRFQKKTGLPVLVESA